jgi:hypothetical protein
MNVVRSNRIGQTTKMETWKPHALAVPHTDQLDLRLGDRVRTHVAIHGVPTGTEGRVILANGFNWQRYRVLFDNSAEVGDLDGRQIEPIGRTLRRIRRAEARANR